MQSTPRALLIAEVGVRTHYKPRVIRDRVRAGTFPEPIDPRLPAQSWRWAEPVIDAYCRGEWHAEVAAS